MESKGRIGIFGGTFNPVHTGHLRVAEEVREIMELKKVFFIPSYIPPHKSESGIADSGHRAQMVRFAIEDNPFFEISTIEIERGGKSYTIDTIEQFKKDYNEEIYLISGIDTFEEFSTWHHVNRLLRSCNFIVTSRPGFNSEKLEKILSETITADYPEIKFTVEKREQTIAVYSIETSDYRLYAVSSILLDISATKIRELLKKGESVKYLVPAEVERYLVSKKIYL